MTVTMIRTEGAAGTSLDGRGVTTTVVETEIEATIVRRDRGEVMNLALVADEAEMSTNMIAGSVSLEARAVMVVVAESGAHPQNE